MTHFQTDHTPVPFLKWIFAIFLLSIAMPGIAQVATGVDTLKTDSVKKLLKLRQAENTEGQYDVGDLFVTIFKPSKKADSTRKPPSGITIIPNVASNPSIGSQIGIKAVAGRKLGTDPNTLLSVAATSASITTKGIIYFYINHNIYTPGNRWNFQGNIVAAKTVSPDYGLGIARPSDGSADDQKLTNAGRQARALNSIYFNFREKVYKEVEKGLFVGAGASFDIRRNITDNRSLGSTPYTIYNQRHGFADDHYQANGLLFNVQYTTRDNQNRAYKGVYIDGGFRVNQTWLGSTKSAVQFNTDLRKYISLSTSHPEHVLAFWNWGSYLIGGAVPYLELPGTAKDPAFRSGRGYVVQYFKGTNFNYSEVEYRFPITRNKFLSGVTFLSMQTANDELGTKLFQRWQPAGGGGLRVLFNKATRTNLCLDYAWGKYGSRGFFLGLNEAF